MTGEESVTKNLIDSIELYSSTLEEQGKSMLIKFVLKSRLNESAKLRLSDNYESPQALIDDMRKHLLTKKSSTSIHHQLMQIRQNSSSIDSYGSKIEQLFVELTISQADGDQNAYKILRPLNEKLAIKSFTNGLRNRQLNTILAARDYSTLKDTIRAAKDEEASCNQHYDGPIPSVYFGKRGGPFTNKYMRGRYIGNPAPGQPSHWQPTRPGNGTRYPSPRGNQHQRGHLPQRGKNSYRGNSYTNRGSFRGNSHGHTNPRIRFISSTNNSSNNANSNYTNYSNDSSALKFFRG